MSEQTGEETTYLDDMVDENPVLFASSETVLTIEDPNLHPMGKATAIFLFFTCMLGFLNGLDYASPDDGRTHTGWHHPEHAPLPERREDAP